MGSASVVTYDHMLRGVKRKDVDCNGNGIRSPSKRAKIINFIIKDYSSRQFIFSPSSTTTSDSQSSHIIDQTDEHDSKFGCAVSLTDSFTVDQIKQHLTSLGGGTTGNNVGDSICQLCAKDFLWFATPPMDCASCTGRIKTGCICYNAFDESGVRYSFCALCFNKARGGRAIAGDRWFPKTELIRCKNVGDSEEKWVQCDRCQRWQHQICALYNSEYDVEGKMIYICPHCRLSELDQVVNNVPITRILGARDLPRTEGSDHIEQRLFEYLALERMSITK